MKVIEHIPTRQNITYLPQEVLDVVVSFVRLNRSSQAAQHDLWSCCLVSRDWYEATIAYLYSMPLLSSRNFTEFARTISPSITSRTRRVGLEDFVRYLDMGGLAYESKKSLTSRLISRTKNSLQLFVAPAVSFSTTSLAPLSKCLALEHLDLSRDVYDFTFDRLSRSIRPLSALKWLSLPKDCSPFEIIPNDTNKATDSTAGWLRDIWPPNLTMLQLNDSHTCPDGGRWTNFLRSLPETLESLSFRNLTVYDAFDSIGQADAEVPQITTLYINVHRSDDTYYFNHMCKPFPNVSKISVPAMTSWVLKNFLFTSQGSSWALNATDNLPGQLRPPQNLELLVLEESPDFPSSTHILVSDLSQFIQHCPRLMRIDAPEAYLNIDEDDDAALDGLNEVLSKRCTDLNGGTRRVDPGSAGIFMTERALNSGVGMKRSFRYRGNG